MVARALIASLALVAIPMAQPGACATATSNATLVIESGAGESRSICVGFDGETTVLDLLERSGLSVRYQDFGGGNVMICQIDGVGCDYPRSECTCEFAGDRIFWGMYLREAGRWSFSQAGASSTAVADGAVVGWRWGAHDGENDPPAFDASQPCDVARTATVAPTGSPGGWVAALALVVALTVGSFFVRARRAAEKQAGEEPS